MARELLLQDMREVSAHLTTPLALNFDGLRPMIKQEQTQTIQRIIGKDTMDAMLAALGDDDTVAAPMQELISKCQYVLAHSAFIHSIAALNVGVSAGGFTVNSAENKAVASMSRIEELKNQLHLSMQIGIDQLTDFLESNLDEFTEYANSDERAERRKTFVWSPKEFNSGLIGVRIGWHVLELMREHMENVQRMTLSKVLGLTYYLAFQQRHEDGELTEAEEKLLKYVRRALACQTFTECVVPMSIVVDERGTYQRFERNSNDPRQTKNVEEGPEHRLVLQHKLHADRLWEELAQYLKANAEDFEEYEGNEVIGEADVPPILPKEPKKGYYTGL
ncbi:hypothetical protein UFOVP350_11 [uncultured Caudovirales phage]|uniref:Uncharacterized protein n=1 Tax=uncultured Caudovirales phage TaxID=2100421 RepID=A0A6J5LYA6_9CAUD|nr:hypothetical protein UFOVP350_11 [uncultured Caudovirales phage]